jgi:hypothetical protein
MLKLYAEVHALLDVFEQPKHFVQRGLPRRGSFFFFRSQSIERWAVLPTEHFSHNEDEYCSAKAAAQEQIQQGIACCG